jgi:hypothetical protein
VTPFCAYPILVLCGATGAMDGPFSQFITTRNPFLRMSWKFQGIFLFLILIIACKYLYKKILNQGQLVKKVKRPIKKEISRE